MPTWLSFWMPICRTLPNLSHPFSNCRKRSRRTWFIASASPAKGKGFSRKWTARLLPYAELHDLGHKKAPSFSSVSAFSFQFAHCQLPVLIPPAALLTIIKPFLICFHLHRPTRLLIGICHIRYRFLAFEKCFCFFRDDIGHLIITVALESATLNLAPSGVAIK